MFAFATLLLALTGLSVKDRDDGFSLLQGGTSLKDYKDDALYTVRKCVYVRLQSKHSDLPPPFYNVKLFGDITELKAFNKTLNHEWLQNVLLDKVNSTQSDKLKAAYLAALRESGQKKYLRWAEVINAISAFYADWRCSGSVIPGDQPAPYGDLDDVLERNHCVSIHRPPNGWIPAIKDTVKSVCPAGTFNTDEDFIYFLPLDVYTPIGSSTYDTSLPSSRYRKHKDPLSNLLRQRRSVYAFPEVAISQMLVEKGQPQKNNPTNCTGCTSKLQWCLRNCPSAPATTTEASRDLVEEEVFSAWSDHIAAGPSSSQNELPNKPPRNITVATTRPTPRARGSQARGGSGNTRYRGRRSTTPRDFFRALAADIGVGE